MSSLELPRTGDIVIVEQGLGVVRFVGDKGKHIGIEIKGNDIEYGNDGCLNGTKYFSTTQNMKNGLFIVVDDIIRTVTSEEILTKLAILYDIVSGTVDNPHFVPCSKYNNILNENETLQQCIYQQNIVIQNLSAQKYERTTTTSIPRAMGTHMASVPSQSITINDNDNDNDIPSITPKTTLDIISDIDTKEELSNITFKCIQSAKATQSGTCKGKSKSNQDSFIMFDRFGPSSTYQLYGVCDGHGPNGDSVSQFVSQQLPNKLNDLLSQSINDIPSILKQTFESIHSTLIQLQQQNELCFDINYSGTTATIGLFAGNKLYVANLGDSRTVLGRTPPISNKNKTVPIPKALSNDHDPTNTNEMIRIKKSKSGKILFEDNDARIQIEIPESISIQSQVKTISASVSRSFGDKIAHEYGGLISQPEVTIHTLSDNDIFVIFASDGIWQMLDNDDVMRMVGTKLNQNKDDKMWHDLQKTTDKLVREADISWKDEYEDYTDDITCVIARIGTI